MALQMRPSTIHDDSILPDCNVHVVSEFLCITFHMALHCRLYLAQVTYVFVCSVLFFCLFSFLLVYLDSMWTSENEMPEQCTLISANHQ